MQIKVNDYTNPDLSGIVNGQPNDATDVTNIFTLTNQVNDILDALSNNVQTTLTTTASITQNQDVNNIVNSSGGAFTITLPAGSGSYKPYHFVKISSDYNKVTIATAGSDKIDNPFLPQAIPTSTSISLVLPGDSADIYWDGTYWRVKYSTHNNVSIKATFSTNQTTNTSLTKAPYNTVDSTVNYGSTWYDSSINYRFTPLIPGIYKITNNLDASGAGLSTVLSYVYKNGTAVSRTATPIDDATQTSGGTTHTSIIYLNGSTDYAEAYYWTANASKTLSSSFCYVSYELTKRLG